jgi:hypothetical protein
MAGFFPSLALLSFLLPAAPACADVFGLWRVQGTLSGVAFVLDCHFIPQATGFGGTCTGAPNGDPKYAGKIYTLKQGFFTGTHVTWGYPSHYLFVSFEVSYLGTLAGDHITGTVTAAGRQGDFTASRE